MLDNLALPFRDESMDAVLSIAVIHHFATTERRVSALRELARVLRIGGRLIISVWAMEQSHRKFESQDVLVPWHRPQHLSTPSLELTSTTNTSEDDCMHYHAYSHTSDSESGKSTRGKKRGKTRRTTRSIDPKAPSPSSSSLSSPNETCYSFVRRAIQKLAGGRRMGVHRPWFMDSWSHKEPPPKRYDPDGCECCECDAQDLPIELRRVDDDEMPQRRQTFPSSQIINDIVTMKSRSLNNMTAMENNNIIRSNSSVASIPDAISTSDSNTSSIRSTKPKLVKQKQSICEEDAEEDLDKPTEIQKLLPDIRIENRSKFRGGVQKQRSLNEELMSTDRLQEKERLRKHIHKQASLNEDLIYHRNYSFENFRDTYFYTSTAKRLQLIKTGFTNKIKSTNIERVTGASLKNGFVRMFQQWKSSEMISPTIPEDDVANSCNVQKAIIIEQCNANNERRSSKEDGSDSSKDSSLQSDTSVDSEDSFASVIFVPKSNPMSPTLSPGPTSPRVNTNSVPNSPRIKQSSCPTSPRIKQMPLSIYPLTKQLSSPKPTTASILSPTDIKLTERRSSIPKPVNESLAQKYAVSPIPKFKPTAVETNSNNNTTTTTKEKDVNLQKIKDLLSSKPGFGARTSKHNYPIVRHSSVSNGKVETIAKPLPKLLSLELFNPETDDKDSDSSAVSSPESVDSVISVNNSETKSKFQFPEVHQERTALLQAARDVAESLDNAVEKVIKSSPRAKRREIKTDEVQSVMQRRYESDRIPLLGDDDWNEECHKHLTDFADKLSEKLLHEIDQYQEKLKCNEAAGSNHSLEHIDDPYIHRLSEELQDLSKLSAEIQKQNEYLAKLSASDKQFYCPKCKKYECRCSSGKQTKRVMKVPAIDINRPAEDIEACGSMIATTSLPTNGNHNKLNKNGASIDSCDSERGSSPNSTISTSTGTGLQLSRHSIESEDTVSRYSGDGGSTASLASCPEWKTIKGKLNIEAQQRSSFDEKSTNSKLSSKDASNKSNLIPSLSDTSQESLPSDNVGGEITYHRYYHVFREGELDQLIEKYVENLHIISSYYDHASWCVVAEKVQVWTI